MFRIFEAHFIDSFSPTVSIIINNYNYEKFLRESIQSAINQDYDFCEIIVGRINHRSIRFV